MKLKDLIEKNRDEFDSHQPDSTVWKRIEATLFSPQKKSLLSNIGIWRAAAIVFFSLSLFLMWERRGNTPRTEVAKIQVEFKDLERFYASQIAEKTMLLNSGDQQEAADAFSQDYQKLEAMYQVLSEQMKTQPSEKLKDALVLNLLVRIDLLNEQLQRLEESRSQRSDSDPASI